MEAILILLMIVAALTAVAVAAIACGADSRDAIGDDRVRTFSH